MDGKKRGGGRGREVKWRIFASVSQPSPRPGMGKE